MPGDREPRVISTVPDSAEVERDVRDDWDGGARTGHARVFPISSILGYHVRNSAREDLGSLEEIMIDEATGRVAYAVLSFGGFLGLGNKLFAIPWEALALNRQDKEFVLNVDREKLERAPGFDKQHWPDMADRNWESEIFAYYGCKPYWER
jgi:sporulation protein YlmC with PRC-barrel domain